MTRLAATDTELLFSRRTALAGAAAAVGLLFLGNRRAFAADPVLRFASIAASSEDCLHLPEGYDHDVLFAWGDPIVPTGPKWDPTAGAGVAEQRLQAGMHHDGMHLFPLPDWPGRYLLAINHEATDEGLLHTDGQKTWSRAKVEKSQAAHGVSIIEIAQDVRGMWRVVPSAYARRITASDPMDLVGEAAGSRHLKTARDTTGTRVLGTLANCAAGQTPWGTYLTCEENFNGYFLRQQGERREMEKRYGIGSGFGYRWSEFDERFRVMDIDPNECNRFGWVVEIDPYDPASTPRKLTGLGRFKHENAFLRSTSGEPVVVYMGDDEADEYLYKFVSEGRLGEDRKANRDLLLKGTLYVAKLDREGPLVGKGKGEWRALVHGQDELVEREGFDSQADELVFAREAARLRKATSLDRPEWVAMNPDTGRVFVSLTNNKNNTFGHILAIDETGNRGDATSFDYEVFAKGGANFKVEGSSTNPQHPALGSPDGLYCDPRGVLWVQTDVSTSKLDQGDYKGFGNNQMVAIDPETLEVRRFLVGPKGCEVTGIVFTPDLKTLFVNIQHPGESPGSPPFSDPDDPAAVSRWPNHQKGRPRSATVAIWRKDGKQVGL